ncbi:hypothetical protein CBR_g22302 [Chara braunii]|uniref:Uncharacterized protein n=1 Tax=Chara braunii TaxID=69332 RepID=A0A388L2K1_CHABU|nr:hypothetical protein CBR_g22302 [Chara braunii]|eukprot:GBG76554.1 hypothetical protein CBR_g22302 [Chara braunii]
MSRVVHRSLRGIRRAPVMDGGSATPAVPGQSHGPTIAGRRAKTESETRIRFRSASTRRTWDRDLRQKTAIYEGKKLIVVGILDGTLRGWPTGRATVGAAAGGSGRRSEAVIGGREGSGSRSTARGWTLSSIRDKSNGTRPRSFNMERFDGVDGAPSHTLCCGISFVRRFSFAGAARGEDAGPIMGVRKGDVEVQEQKLVDASSASSSSSFAKEKEHIEWWMQRVEECTRDQARVLKARLSSDNLLGLNENLRSGR